MTGTFHIRVASSDMILEKKTDVFTSKCLYSWKGIKDKYLTFDMFQLLDFKSFIIVQTIYDLEGGGLT